MFYRAEVKDVATIADIVRETITSIYPKYYPSGVVEFFLNHHSTENIRDMIIASVILLWKNAKITSQATTETGNWAY